MMVFVATHVLTVKVISLRAAIPSEHVLAPHPCSCTLEPLFVLGQQQWYSFCGVSLPRAFWVLVDWGLM